MGMKGFKNNMDAIRYAAEMAKRIKKLSDENDILSVDESRGVHVTSRVFNGCFKSYRIVPHSDGWDALETWVDGVRVFCLVQKEKQPDEVAHQSV